MATRNCKGEYVASPESTGGGGYGFQWRMQALFAILMICDSELVTLPGKKIIRLEFQTKYKGFGLDDIRLVLVDKTGKESQVLAQIKESLTFAPSNDEFRKTILAAWADFNNGNQFDEKRDACLLVTGPLAAKDRNSIERLCNYARTRAGEDFEGEVLKGIGISAEQVKLYRDIKGIVEEQLDLHVDGPLMSRFLSHIYHVQPDTLYGCGLMESYAQAVLTRCFNTATPKQLFESIVYKMSHWDRLRGHLSKDILIRVLEEDNVTIRLSPMCDSIRQSICQVGGAGNDSPTAGAAEKDQRGGNAELEIVRKFGGSRKSDLAVLCLIGTWNETVDADKKFLREVLSEAEEAVDRFIKELTGLGLIETKSGISHVIQRRRIWRITAKTVSKLNVDRFISRTKAELSRIDVSLNVKPDERFMSGVYGRKDFASKILREGIAKGMAMLVVDCRFCCNVAHSEQASWGWKFIRDILGKSDWRIWATLDDEIRYLAEVSPDEFMRCLRIFMGKRKGGLAALYNQETGGIGSRTYSVGIVEALGCLAWNSSLLGEVVNILTDMVKRDPGGQWHPRPIDKLRYILHPLAPHTWASQIRRVSVVRGVLCRFDNDTSWKLIESLLPVEHYSFMGSSTAPIFRGNGRSEKLPKRTNKEVWDEYAEYCKMAIRLCGSKEDRIGQLINDALRCWPNDSFCALVSYAKETCSKLKEETRFEIWRSIRNALYYANLSNENGGRKWITERVDSYKLLENIYQPTDVLLRSRVLFTWRDELYDRKLNDCSDEDIRRQQEDAIATIRRLKGSEAALAFASKTDKSDFAGYLTGLISDGSDDQVLLPKLLSEPKDGLYWPVSGYVAGRFESKGWEWIDSIDMSKWDSESIATLFVMLPFRKDVWTRVAETLGDDKRLYWAKKGRPYVAEIADVHDAVDGFLSAGCGYKALDVVAHFIILKKGDVIEESRQVMKAFVEGRVHDNPTTMAYHNVCKVISYIQAFKSVPDDEKAQIEWTFIDLADWYGGHGFKAVFLGAKLAKDADFFCEAIRLVYLPEKEAKKIKEKRNDNPLPKEELHRIENIMHLLEHGLHAPGFGADGKFVPVEFNRWVKKVLSVAKKEDRLSSAKGVLGKMFINAVNKGEDFWLPHEIARLMEKKGNDRMLRSFKVAMLNARGLHAVDKTGKEDVELAAKYEKMADEAEGFGYNGIAREVRQVASYIREDWERYNVEDKSLTAYFDANKEDLEQSRIEESDKE